MFKIGDEVEIIGHFSKGAKGTVVEAPYNDCGYDCFVLRRSSEYPLGFFDYELKLIQPKETTQMFEVGKKYAYGQKTPVATCLYADDETVTLRYDGNRHPVCAKPSKLIGEGWVEYVEPKVITTELFVRTNGVGVWLNDGSYRDTNKNKTIGKIRITHVEGSGLAVEVIG